MGESKWLVKWGEYGVVSSRVGIKENHGGFFDLGGGRMRLSVKGVSSLVKAPEVDKNLISAGRWDFGSPNLSALHPGSERSSPTSDMIDLYCW